MTDATRAAIRAQLRIDEGVREKPYRDSVGVLTIGVGRNLDAVGLLPDEIDILLRNDVAKAEAACSSYAYWDELSENAQAALVNMCFNLGAVRFSAFHQMHAALVRRDYVAAASEMRASLWAEEVGERAERLAKVIESENIGSN